MAFLLGGFALWWLVLYQPVQPAFTALVRAEEVVLTGPPDEVVAAVLVEPYDRVRRGDVLCTFEGATLESELAVARAEALALEAEIAAERARLAAERRRIEFDARTQAERDARERETDRRRFELDREELRIELLEHQVELAALEVDRRRYDVRRQFLAGLEEPGLLASRSEVAELEARLAAIADERARREQLVEAAAGALANAEERLAALGDAVGPDQVPAGVDADAVVEPLRRRVDVQVARIAQLEVGTDRLVLRAPTDGRVERLAAHPGRRAVAGEELVAICADGPRRADLFVPESAGQRFAVGEELELVDAAGGGARWQGQVLAEAPRFVQLPLRLWRDPRVPEHGLAYLVALPDGVDALAGARLLARRAD